ncbi:fluoride efflux transporter CrcB [Bacillus taeanensis]|uniref:Fluoride-specific ion channel FluC n=1 Tax=Bacillus taeanensis TaxID=273032 RepID=A0A366XWB2_9BACI|nr:fluoride efflux transporter CrcB [Bacillus taeanensis]RBW69059.1 fluoride efflux transporter CrcB [Bacillus taeanensis]
MINVLLVAVGGFFGAITRFTISGWVKAYVPSLFPYGTLFVNICGSFLLGVLIGADVETVWKLLVGVGFMGAFTTFSTFKVEVIALIEKRSWKLVIAYVSVSYIGGIIFAYFGYYFKLIF